MKTYLTTLLLHRLFTAMPFLAAIGLSCAALSTSHAQEPTAAVVVLHHTQGNQAEGVIRFELVGEKQVRVSGTVEGLTPNSAHAIHIHQFGDCTSPDGSSAGGHYNPEGHQHALLDKAKRHAGDLGNLQADAQGKAILNIVMDTITINGSKNPIIGRGVIVHEKADDGGQPTGNAGDRIACGVIGWAKP